ncbi:hypothetical protein GWK48_10010 [Metallosphaera tengchongensis]|uniref:Uncharacterized protein n=1 Tax=Metallosphaera tengchongensis TaxID=1532350 RepID=A0A6N0NV42_9CREN|nr:hypothetical protein [Metallosphaera tengchongensis]QKR00676.1 hypothetical protein GWK48_10010 [Metallosphaera tengchongensis]
MIIKGNGVLIIIPDEIASKVLKEVPLEAGRFNQESNDNEEGSTTVKD